MIPRSDACDNGSVGSFLSLHDNDGACQSISGLNFFNHVIHKNSLYFPKETILGLAIISL
jgi:hypothetical protein